jgi:hypothetical protein
MTSPSVLGRRRSARGAWVLVVKVVFNSEVYFTSGEHKGMGEASRPGTPALAHARGLTLLACWQWFFYAVTGLQRLWKPRMGPTQGYLIVFSWQVIRTG